jgi:hypothetical protein
MFADKLYVAQVVHRAPDVLEETVCAQLSQRNARKELSRRISIYRLTPSTFSAASMTVVLKLVWQ